MNSAHDIKIFKTEGVLWATPSPARTRSLTYLGFKKVSREKTMFLNLSVKYPVTKFKLTLQGKK